MRDIFSTGEKSMKGELCIVTAFEATVPLRLCFRTIYMPYSWHPISLDELKIECRVRFTDGATTGSSGATARL